MLELKKSNRLIGLKQSRKAISEGTAGKAYFAKDADPRMTVWIDTMAELGAACGIDVGAAVAVVLKARALSEGIL